MDLKVASELLDVVSTGLLDDQRTLASFKEKLEAHPEAAETLDPLIKRLQDTCAHLQQARTDLRMLTVVSRT